MRTAIRLWFAACAMGIAGVARGQTFDLVGMAPGGTASWTYGLSADGRIATGWSNAPGPGGATGYTWTRAGGRMDFGLEPGITFSGAYGISADGTTVTGLGNNQHAFRYRGPGTYQDLGLLPGFSQAFGVAASGDGAVIVGRGQASDSQAFRWTQATGMQAIPFPAGAFRSLATGVTRDGGTVVGYSTESSGNGTDAFLWNPSGGYTMLPHLAGSNFATSTANGINFNGTLVVGRSGFNGNNATMWVNGVPMDLGMAPGWARSYANAVDDDGSVVVGTLFAGGLTQTAGIWTPDHGMEVLADYLTRNGVTIPAGLTLFDAYALSSDGRTICGRALSGNSGPYGFVVMVPSPPTALVALSVACFAIRRQRRVDYWINGE